MHSGRRDGDLGGGAGERTVFRSRGCRALQETPVRGAAAEQSAGSQCRQVRTRRMKKMAVVMYKTADRFLFALSVL